MKFECSEAEWPDVCVIDVLVPLAPTVGAPEIPEIEVLPIFGSTSAYSSQQALVIHTGPIGNTISNSIGNSIGNTIGNTIGNSIETKSDFLVVPVSYIYRYV